MEIVPSPRPDWEPLPTDGYDGIEGQLLINRPEITVSLLRLSQGATVPPHPDPDTAYVICRDGSGVVQVGEEEADISAGEFVVWPAGLIHGLRSGLEGMTVLVIHAHTA